MTAEQTETEADWLEREVKMITAQLRDLKTEMFRMQARARDGDLSAAKEAQKTVVDVRTFLSRATETEARLAEIRQADGRGARGYALDLDGARASIRCRLDRLRRCHGAG